MNRTLKDATAECTHTETYERLHEYLAAFSAAYNCVKRLETSCGLMPHEYAGKTRKAAKAAFRIDSTWLLRGLCT